ATCSVSRQRAPFKLLCYDAPFMLESQKMERAEWLRINVIRRAGASLDALVARIPRYSYTAAARIYLIFAAILTVPLIFATISRPLAYWDYISVFTSFTPIAPQDEWQTLWPNLKFQFGTGGSRFFPSYTALFQGLMVVFDGEYWA